MHTPSDPAAVDPSIDTHLLDWHPILPNAPPPPPTTSPTMSAPSYITFLPPPFLPGRVPSRRRRLTHHDPQMLSRSVSKFLRRVQAGAIRPVKPASLGIKTRIPRSATLFHDRESRVAIAMCRRRSRFATKEAHSVLNVLRPLVENETVHSFVIAMDGPASVCSKAATLVEEAGGELLGKQSLDAALACLTEEEKESRHPSEHGENANVLAYAERDGTVGTVGGAAREEGNTSRLRFLSRQRRKDAQKRRRHHFELCAHHEPAGDQPKAISFLTDGLLEKGKSFQTLHGVTGSGKTFMMANIIAKADRPTLILAPNKTLAAQLCNELSNLFPKNRVEFFVSSFKFYQPEAYLPNSDKYIAKASAIDPDVDRLRHAATRSLFERNDTIVVASVSSIYGLGLPTEYLESSIRIHVGDKLEGGVSELTESLNNVQYVEASGKGITSRGSFHVTSDKVEIAPPWEAEGILYRILFENNVIVRMEFLNTNTSESIDLGHEVVLYPARHFVTPKGQIEAAILQIEEETKKCVTAFRADGKELEASRLEERVATDMEMMRKVGFCSGAENYSLYLSKRTNGITTSPPRTLLDYMPRDGKWLLFIDESHVTVPQLGAMYSGNAARKKKLVRHGFRLPSAMENRPLNSKEFWEKTHQTIFVSATPGNLELERSGANGVCEAVIRPTGIVDPTIEVVPTKGQVEHLALALAKVAAAGGRAIVTTLTKRFAEDLADCISRKPAIHGVLDRPLRVSFLHSEIDSVGRMQVLEAMRGDINLDSESSAPKLDVIVGVNLLREGIDLPAVRLVAILDADSEGFLRGETALIQTIGRAARNTEGHVVMYANTVTSSMHRAITETRRRRRLQMAHNSIYDIIPSGVGAGTRRSLNAEEKTLLDRIRKLKLEAGETLKEKSFGKISDKAVQEQDPFKFAEASADLTDLGDVRQKMLMAASAEDFETAALLRDRLVSLEQR